MYEYYFTFRSLTRAQQAVQLLRGQALGGELVRIPKALTSMGCGYAVRVYGSDSYPAAAMLRTAGVGFERIFGLDHLGVAREVAL